MSKTKQSSSDPYLFDTSLATLLDQAAKEHPTRAAILTHTTRISYAELKERAEQLAAGLAHFGLGQGSRIVLMLPNMPETIIAFWGIAKLGGVIQMMNPLYREKEIVQNITDSQATAIIVQEQLWPKIEPLRKDLPLTTFFLVKSSESPEKLPQEHDVDTSGCRCWDELFAFGTSFPEPVSITGDTTLLLQYTGGTTGTSKGVILTHGNMGANAKQIQHFFHLNPDTPEIFLSILPFFHVYGLSLGLVQPVCIHATTIPLIRFDPRETLQTISECKPTIFPSAPAMYISLLQQKDLPKYDLKSIRICMSGSAPLAQEIFTRFQHITGASIVEGYGLTEASPVTHFIPLGAEGTKQRSIGIPLPATDARIVDMEAGAIPLEPGKKGELVVRGPQVMKGYLNNPDETASAVRNDWLYTGDIAMMDEDGYFYIVDRKKDMVIVGGYNVFPREVDEVLASHPKILEAVSVGLDDPLRGEILKAYIVPKAGEHLTKSEIVAFCRTKLASYKVPRQIEFRDALPRTIVGKILRRHLRDEEMAKQKEKNAAKEGALQPS
ncbi:MAG: long-chain fatty acid--CoA ligase [Desulfovibrio sp.]|nr:long-chain fatty acid--CoA ligase [Desulfovibrio sp.]